MANWPPWGKSAISWSELSQDQKSNIANKIVAALNSIGIKDTTARWRIPEQLPHYQLIIETPWCASKSRGDVSRALDQAIARASIYVPMNGIILGSPQQK
jgi:hypothetical protein